MDITHGQALFVLGHMRTNIKTGERAGKKKNETRVITRKRKKKVVEIFWSRAKIMVARFSIDYRYSAGQQGSVARFWRWPKDL